MNVMAIDFITTYNRDCINLGAKWAFSPGGKSLEKRQHFNYQFKNVYVTIVFVNIFRIFDRTSTICVCYVLQYWWLVTYLQFFSVSWAADECLELGTVFRFNSNCWLLFVLLYYLYLSVTFCNNEKNKTWWFSK